MTAILSNAQAAQRFLASDPVNLQELREILSDIVTDDKRAAVIVRSIGAMLQEGSDERKGASQVNAIPVIIYIVDDEADVRKALSRLLRSAGYTTRLFGSAGEFLVSGEARFSAGCIILDLAMPGLNGLELQEHLTASDCHRPIIFLTGNGDISKSVRAMKAGAVNFPDQAGR